MKIAPHPAASHYKKTQDLRSCKSCTLTVMAKGDWQGWKGVDMGNAEMAWFCDKAPCQEARDLAIAMRAQELTAAGNQIATAVPGAQTVPGQARSLDQVVEGEASKADEIRALHARIAELEAAQGEEPPQEAEEAPESADEPEVVQSTAPDPSPGMPSLTAQHGDPTAPDPTPGFEPSEYAGQTVHAADSDGKPMCDAAAEGPCLKTHEIPFDAQTCDGCIDKFTSVNEGREKNRPVPAEVVALGVDGVESARMVEATVFTFKQISEAPRFNDKLIKQINGGERPDVIMIGPEAYPQLPLEKTEPEQLRTSISNFFESAKLEVDVIERAASGPEFLGIAFSLRDRA